MRAPTRGVRTERSRGTETEGRTRGRGSLPRKERRVGVELELSVFVEVTMEGRVGITRVDGAGEDEVEDEFEKVRFGIGDGDVDGVEGGGRGIPSVTSPDDLTLRM